MLFLVLNAFSSIKMEKLLSKAPLAFIVFRVIGCFLCFCFHFFPFFFFSAFHDKKHLIHFPLEGQCSYKGTSVRPISWAGNVI